LTVAVTGVRETEMHPCGLTASAYQVVVVVIVGLRMVISFPPVNASYHFMVPELAVADNTTWPDPQTREGVTDAEVTVGNVFTVAVTAVRDADLHPSGLNASA
jgi:hypothetical protein